MTDLGDDLLVLVVDIGSSSIRGSICGRDGRTIRGLTTRVEHRFDTDRDGKATLDTVGVQEQVERIIDNLLAQLSGLQEKISGVGMATLVGNAVGLDRSGYPVTPLYTYADSRPHEDLRLWRSLIGDSEQVIYDRTGCPQHTAYLPARFIWLSRTDPGTWKRIDHWSDLGGYLYNRWFGLDRPVCSYSVASWTGLLDRRRLDWDQAILAHLPIRADQLPELSDYDRHLRGLVDPWASRWPGLRDRPFFLAVGDGAAANLGSGGVDPSVPVVTIGSTSAVRLILEGTPAVPRGLWCYRVDSRLSLLGGALAEGGNVCLWLARTLRLDMSAVESELASMAPDSHGLTVLPFWYGERSPGWSADARAAIAGLSAATRPAEIVRACMESIAYGLAMIVDRIAETRPGVSELIGSGNALLSSPTWLQILADVLGCPIRACAEQESTSRGVALMVLKALGVIEDYTEVPACLGRVYRPNQQNHAIYREAIRRRQDLYAKLITP